MKIRVKLLEADRVRLDLPEWFEIDPTLSAREAWRLSAGFTVDGLPLAFDTPGEWRKALFADDAGALLYLVWLGLKRTGRDVPIEDLDFNQDRIEWDALREPEDEPILDAEGKAESGTTSP